MKNFKLSRKTSSLDLEKQNSELGKKNLQMKEEIYNYYVDDEQNNENFGSKSWQKYVNKTCPELFEKFLDISDFTKIADDKNKDKVFKKQESNKKLSDLFTKSYIDLKQSNQINGWNFQRTKNVICWRDQLEYSYVVNYYFMFHLKKRESVWSWVLIVFSSFCSVLTLIYTDIIFLKFVVSYGLSLLAIMTSLIAAFIKKENYVERIKNMDRYTQKVGQVCTELTGIMDSKPWNRMSYVAFIDKYKDQITALFSFPPPISPIEFKKTVYKLTKYHPELIREKFPWFRKVTVGKLEYFEMTDWGKNILDSYYLYKYDKCYRRICCCICENPHKHSKFYDPISYNAELLKFLSNEKKFKQSVAKQQVNHNSNLHSDLTDRSSFKSIVNEVEKKKTVTDAFEDGIIDDELDVIIDNNNIDI
jgi:hypothetical protein